MAEESTTPDLVELLRRAYEAASRRDLDGLSSFVAADAVWDMSAMGMGRFEGRVAFLGFQRDWWAAYEEFEIEPGEIVDLGSGVLFAVVNQNGKPVGSTGKVGLRFAQVGVWRNGLTVLTANYTDIDEARAAAERLAEERG